MSKVQSNALWPKGVCHTKYGNNITTDTHQTEAQAKAVCQALEQYGFGGDGLEFPIKTWISQIQQPPVIPCECKVTNLDGLCVECGKEVE